MRAQGTRAVSIFPPSMAVTFFFQAEDGIRDADVTGVQTCALPIWGRGLGEGEPFSNLLPWASLLGIFSTRPKAHPLLGERYPFSLLCLRPLPHRQSQTG